MYVDQNEEVENDFGSHYTEKTYFLYPYDLKVLY